MSIYKNLRALRAAKGMTQEEVAERMGLTRQAISSYESGRTQPDLETLTRLAEVYGTDLEAVLYGQSRAQSEERGLKWAAGVVLAGTLLLTLARAVLRWMASQMFPLMGMFSPGTGTQITAELKPLWEAHISLIKASEAMEGLAYMVMLVGGVVVLVLLWKKSRPLSIKWKLCYVAALADGMMVCTIPFAWMDEQYGWGDYMLLPELMAARVVIFLLLSVLLDWLKKRRRQKTAQ